MEIIAIHKIPNLDILSYYSHAVLDTTMHADDGEPYNESGFTYDELREEIIRRMNKDII